MNYSAFRNFVECDSSIRNSKLAEVVCLYLHVNYTNSIHITFQLFTSMIEWIVVEGSRHILFWGRLALHSTSIPMYKSSFIYQPRRRLPHYYLQSLPASQLSWAFYECSSQNIFPHCCSPQRNEGTRFLFQVSKVLPKCRGKRRFTRRIKQLENITIRRFHTWRKPNV